jgi:peroxiredoxin
MLKKWMYLLGLVIAVLIAFYAYRKYRIAPHIDLNALNLVSLEQQPVKMASFSGKKVIVCFSASWCGNCREELDVLASIKEKELSDVEIVVISDETLEKIRSFKEKHAYPFTFLKMDRSFNSIGINSIPTSYIINTRLNITKETVGYLNWQDPSTLQHLKKLME